MKLTQKWLKEKNACSKDVEWFAGQKETDGIKVVKKLLKVNLEWGNWLIVRIMTQPQYIKYAVFAAEEVSYLWKDKYPEQYAEWKKWVDDGCSAARAARSAARAAWSAAWSAAASTARSAARSAESAARSAESAAASTAESAERSAARAARSAARSAESAAARKKMQIKILEYGIELLKKGAK